MPRKEGSLRYGSATWGGARTSRDDKGSFSSWSQHDFQAACCARFPSMYFAKRAYIFSKILVCASSRCGARQLSLTAKGRAFDVWPSTLLSSSIHSIVHAVRHQQLLSTHQPTVSTRNQSPNPTPSAKPAEKRHRRMPTIPLRPSRRVCMSPVSWPGPKQKKFEIPQAGGLTYVIPLPSNELAPSFPSSSSPPPASSLPTASFPYNASSSRKL